ncbi:MAG: hypothetical protein P8177_04950 [Gemmatimonadota bacterium]|jgi:hypothetical protein
MMEDVTRKRVLRMLERLPEEQLYQVVDYMEFLEAKYARDAAKKPDAFQQFAERVEDQMRLRSVAPRAMRGTMRAMSTAGRFLDGVRELGRDLVGPPPRDRPAGRPNGTGQSTRTGPAESEPEREPPSGGSRTPGGTGA